MAGQQGWPSSPENPRALLLSPLFSAPLSPPYPPSLLPPRFSHRSLPVCRSTPKTFQAAARARSPFPPIAPPSAPLTNTPPSSSSSSEEEERPEGISGKELDLFYRGGDNNGGFGRRSTGGGGGSGGGGGGGGRGGERDRQGPHAGIVAGAGTTPGGLPAERTSYVFCPEAHGMMRYVRTMSGYGVSKCSRATWLMGGSVFTRVGSPSFGGQVARGVVLFLVSSRKRRDV